mmetsp:Transcript_12100/g.19083  ORF Transcript_12100/g.19083 Transcript_12100/m.19083 type:complete len:255 (-) Transcript_12100:78-842(-)
MSDASSTSSLLELKLQDAFDQQIEDLSQYLQRLRLARSEEKAELALESFYIAVSEEDSRLSQDGREELKAVLVQDELAIKTILAAMKRKYSNARFYRRALSCLMYFIRDSEDHACQFVALGGMEFTIEIMHAFEKNEVIQWYCFDLLGKLVPSGESYNDLAVKTLVSSIVGTMLDMHDKSPHIYERACGALASILQQKRNMREAVARHVAGVSRAIVRGCSLKSQDPMGVEGLLLQDIGRLTVCHDILDMAFAK